MDFCLLCSYGQEQDNLWAAVQAIGGLLGLAIAVGVAVWQARQYRSAQFQRYAAQTQVAHYFAMRVSMIFDEAWQAENSNDIHRIKMLEYKLQDLVSWSRTFLLDTLNYHKMASFIEIRDKAIELMLWMKNCVLDGSAPSEVERIFSGVSKDIFWFGVNIPDWAVHQHQNVTPAVQRNAPNQ